MIEIPRVPEDYGNVFPNAKHFPLLLNHMLPCATNPSISIAAAH